MKSVKQKLENIFFNCDFTTAIADGIVDYSRLCGYKLPEKTDNLKGNDKEAGSTVCLDEALTTAVTDNLKITV
jgi:hypothetical protein